MKATVLVLFALLAISFAALSASTPPLQVSAQSRATSTPPGVQTVNLVAGPHAEPGVALENDSVRRLFACKLVPASESTGFAFTSSAEMPALYAGARLRID